MATMACYPSFDQQQQQTSTRSSGVVSNNSNQQPQQQKDYSKPLHVDCSVEYELPNQARPPGKSEPLLMIHPCFYRRAESQRRSPFINNLPQPVQQQQTRRTSSRNTTSSTTNSSNNNSNTSSVSSNNNNNALLLQQQRYAAQQQQMRYMEQVQQQQQQVYQQSMVNAAWNMDQNSAAIYCKPPTTRSTRRNSRKSAAAAAAAAKEIVLSSRTNNGGHATDYTSSSGDSGISGVLWTDTERSPADQQRVVHHQQNGLGNVDTINLPTHITSDKNIINNGDSTQTQQPTSRRGGYSLRSDSNNGDLAELLAAACGAEHLPPLPKIGSAPGKTQLPSQPQSASQQQQQQHGAMCQQLGGRCVCLPRSQQQPAVGVAAVACRSCRPQLQPQIQQSYQPPQQANTVSNNTQPWPAQFAHPPAAVPATACEPEPAAAASGQVRRAWSRSGPTSSAKRSRVSQQQQQQQQQITTTFPNTSSSPWVNNPFLESNTPVWPQQQQQQQRQTTSCGLNSSNNNNNNNNSSGGKDCGGSMCKVCCPNNTTASTSNNTVPTPHIQQQSFQQQQQQQQQQSTQESTQWNASYYCRGASEDGGRMLWNNENMLRLFQV